MFPSSVFQSFLPLNYAVDEAQINGWISQPGQGFDTNQYQYLFINHRMMKDRLLMHAVRQAYEGMLPDASYPAFVLFLTVSPQQLDVNVHPAKHEVRFHHAREVHDALYQSINEVLCADVNQIPMEQERQHAYSSNSRNFTGDVVSNQAPANVSAESTHDYIKPLTSAGERTKGYHHASHAGSSARSNVTTQVQLSGENYTKLLETQVNPETRVIGIGTKVIVKLQQRVYVQDQAQLAFALLQKLFGDFAKESIQQPLLMPVTAKFATVNKDALSTVSQLGFDIQQRQERIVLLQVPAMIRHLPWTGLFALWLERLFASDQYSPVEQLAHAWCQHQPPSESVLMNWLNQASLEQSVWLKGAIELSADKLATLQ